MKLVVTTPAAIVVEEDGVTAVRAEDESGSFGILSGHADFLTVLNISILRWHSASSAERYCAVRRGVLTVTGGETVTVATREAVPGEDAERLTSAVLRQFRQTAEEERAARVESARLRAAAIRRIIEYLRPERRGPFRSV